MATRRFGFLFWLMKSACERVEAGAGSVTAGVDTCHANGDNGSIASMCDYMTGLLPANLLHLVAEPDGGRKFTDGSLAIN